MKTDYITFNKAIVSEDKLKEIVDKFIEIVKNHNLDITVDNIIEADLIIHDKSYTAYSTSTGYYMHMTREQGPMIFLDWRIDEDGHIYFECREHGDTLTTKTKYDEKNSHISTETYPANQKE